MSKLSGRKLDLLQDCNNLNVPPREFMAVWCKRCRNGDCVNAGWAESRWSDRINSQVSRLLTDVHYADPNDPNFKDIRSLSFKEVAAPIYVIGSDPWAGPSVHLADPEKATKPQVEVERAISALAESKGKPSPPSRAIEASLPISPEKFLGMTERETPPEPQASLPTAPTSPETPPKPNPRFFQNPGEKMVNTEFPSEGIMLDGSPPPSTQVGGGPVDPWAAPVNPAPKKVSVGAKVKMGG